MEERMGEYSPSSSLKTRLKNSITNCFKHNNPHQHHHIHNHSDNDDSPRQERHRTLVRSSSGGMMRNLINRIGTPRNGHHYHHHHRKSKSTDFRYDPESYALNFDDDENSAFDEIPFRNFSSRLPPSPLPQPSRLKSDPVAPVMIPPPSSPRLPPSTSSPREITACI